MFTWICPQCGGEVPPSYAACPRCSGAKPQPHPPPAQQPAQTAPPQPQAAPPPPPPVHQAPPPHYQAPPPPPSYVLAEPRRGMPGWLVMLLVAAVIGGGLFGLYKLMSTGSGSAAPKAVLQSPGEEDAGAHPYQKHVEVTGLRLFEDERKRIQLRYVVVNHSMMDLNGLEFTLNLTTTAAGPNDAPLAVVNAKVGQVPAHGSKDMQAPIETRARAYELPDWQFLKANIQITAPAP